MVAPTLIDGVSSGGVYPAAGVTCAQASVGSSTPATAAHHIFTSRRFKPPSLGFALRQLQQEKFIGWRCLWRIARVSSVLIPDFVRTRRSKDSRRNTEGTKGSATETQRTQRRETVPKEPSEDTNRPARLHCDPFTRPGGSCLQPAAARPASRPL